MTFVITPVGDGCQESCFSALVFEAEKKKFGEKMAHDLLSSNMKSLIGDDLVKYHHRMPTDTSNEPLLHSEKYDDGWEGRGERSSGHMKTQTADNRSAVDCCGWYGVNFIVERQQKRHRDVRMLAIDDLHRECEEMQAKLNASRDLSNIGMGLQILSYEMNVRSAINGTLDKDSTSELSLQLQGPLTPETKLRVMAEAARRIEQAEKIYDAAHSMK